MTYNKRRLTTVAAVAVTAALTLAACGSGGAQGRGSADAKGTIKVATIYDIGAGMDPATTTGALPIAVNWHVVEGLTELDPATREAYLALAASDPKKIDDTHYEVAIRKDAKFSDDKAVTADDVVFSYNRVLDPGNKKTDIYKGFLGFIDKVEKKNDTTVTMTLKHPFSLLKQRLSVVKIVPKDSKAEDLDKTPVGSGPFKIEKAEKGKVVTLAKNDKYNGKHPAKVANIQFDIIPDDTARATAMIQGTDQAIESVSADLAAKIKDKSKVEAVQGFNLPFLMFNTKKAPFDNPKVRQAFFYAINTDKLIKDTLGGDATAATSFLPQGHPNYNKAKVVYNYDPAKAKSLLAEAGAANLKVTLNSTDHPWIKNLLPQVQQDLKAVGIEVTLNPQKSAALYPNIIDTTDYDLALAPGDPSVFGSDPDILMRWWYGKNVWTEKRERWADSPEFAQLTSILDKALGQSGDDQQKSWNQAFDLISEQVPLYPLFHRKVVTAWDDKKLDNFRPIPLTGLSLLDVGLK